MEENMGFFSEIMEFFKLVMIGGFVLCIVFMVLVALPRSPFRDFVMQGLLWSIVLLSGFLVLSPADFIPLLPFDDLIAGGTGLSAAAVAMAQKIRHAREDKERAKATGLQPVHSANVKNIEAA
jgi:hypothetical protein